MHRPFQIGQIRSGLIEKGEGHCVMRIGDGEPHSAMKKTAPPWQERFAKDHRSNGYLSDKAAAVILRLGPAADWTGVNALIIPGALAVGVQPFGETSQDTRYLVC